MNAKPPLVPPIFNRELLYRRGMTAVVLLVLALSTVLTEAGRTRLMGWGATFMGALSAEPANSVFHARATNLTVEQSRTARWIARKHRVSLPAVEQIVSVAFESAAIFRLDPYLILAVISVESGFNPLAESKAGAKGLMQVIPEYHKERFAQHGGLGAALNPWANIQVGSGIIREYLDRFKTIESALLAYVGVGPTGVSGYPDKVMRIREQMRAASQGRVLA